MYAEIAAANYCDAGFAVAAVLCWLRAGQDVACQVPRRPRGLSVRRTKWIRAGLGVAMLLPFLGMAFPRGVGAASLTLYGAGSLQGAMSDVVNTFSRTSGIVVATQFGPSGLLRERIERGERPDIFASADLGHPTRLASQGLATAPVVFARNRLCVVGKSEARMRPDGLLDLLLDPAVRVGASTPKADPSGDYTWTMFQRAEALRPGSFTALDRKALQVVDGPTNSPPAEGKGAVAAVFLRNSIDLYVGYWSSGRQTAKEVPGLAIVDIPDTLNVPAEYGLAILTGATPQAADLAAFILAPQGQAILLDYGFDPGGAKNE